jgi:hypothetical protein
MQFAYGGACCECVANERLVVANIPGDYFQHIVPDAGHGIALGHLRVLHDILLKLHEVLSPGGSEIDCREDDNLHAQGIAIQQRHASLDIPLLLETVYAPPAGRLGHVDALGNGSGTKGGILLHYFEDGYVLLSQLIGQFIHQIIIRRNKYAYLYQKRAKIK